MTNTTRTCLKCKHVNPQATGSTDEACPSCGAIYARVEAYLQNNPAKPAPIRAAAPPAQSGAIQTPDKPAVLIDPAFVSAMRAASLYPNFRVLVKVIAWMFYLFAIGSVIASWASSSESNNLRIGSIFFSIFVFFVVTAVKEASLMLADLSDAAVIQASRAGKTQ